MKYTYKIDANNILFQIDETGKIIASMLLAEMKDLLAVLRLIDQELEKNFQDTESKDLDFYQEL